jgi:DNA-binding transcriptional ArsR family regulator
MPERLLVAGELARFLGVLAHPYRIHIVEELRGGERDVNALQAALGISHSGVSQHLALLRAHRLVTDRRVGRRVFYRLLQPALAAWLTTGLTFIEPESHQQFHVAVEHVRGLWKTEPPPPLSSNITTSLNAPDASGQTISIEPQEGI